MSIRFVNSNIVVNYSNVSILRKHGEDMYESLPEQVRKYYESIDCDSPEVKSIEELVGKGGLMSLRSGYLVDDNDLDGVKFRLKIKGRIKDALVLGEDPGHRSDESLKGVARGAAVGFALLGPIGAGIGAIVSGNKEAPTIHQSKEVMVQIDLDDNDYIVLKVDEGAFIAIRELYNECVSSGVVASEVEETKECPDCAETIKIKAKVCRYCGRKFSQDEIDDSIGHSSSVSYVDDSEEKNSQEKGIKETFLGKLCDKYSAEIGADGFVTLYAIIGVLEYIRAMQKGAVLKHLTRSSQLLFNTADWILTEDEFQSLIEVCSVSDIEEAMFSDLKDNIGCFDEIWTTYQEKIKNPKRGFFGSVKPVGPLRKNFHEICKDCTIYQDDFMRDILDVYGKDGMSLSDFGKRDSVSSYADLTVTSKKGIIYPFMDVIDKFIQVEV